MKDKIILISVFTMLTLLTFNFVNLFSSKNIEVNKVIYETQYEYTHYYPGDAWNSNDCTGSGKCVKDFKTDSQGWYYYNQNGKDYLVVAAATVYCRDRSDHCGISSRRGIARSIKYYHYGDILTLPINGKMYDAMVLDSCGACMWASQDTHGKEKIDIFVQNPNSKVPDGGGTINETDENDDVGISYGTHTTTFSGDINQGWLMYRAKQREEWKDSNKEITEDNIDEAVNEIFERAEESYGEYIEYLKNNNIYFDPEEAGPYTSWLQTNPAWGGMYLGDSSYTMSSSGCAVTAVAIQFARMGFDVTPGSLLQYLNTHGGFESGGSGALKWNVATQFVGNVNYIGADSTYNNAGSNTALKLSRIGELLKEGNKYIIVHINGGRTNNHWVAVTGVTENDLKIIDSGGFSSSDRTSFNTTFGLQNLDAKNIRIYTKN